MVYHGFRGNQEIDSYLKEYPNKSARIKELMKLGIMAEQNKQDTIITNEKIPIRVRPVNNRVRVRV